MEVNDRLIIVIGGPTAVGKTQVALSVATRSHVEIVCADSRQLYSLLNIGTAKPTETEMQVCPHHLFSVYHPTSSVTAGSYATLFRDFVRSQAPNTPPLLVVGGSGLYIRAALDGLSVAGTVPNLDVRLRVTEMLQHEGKLGLYRRLLELDPVAAERYSDMNPRRVQRALEYIMEYNEPFSNTWQRKPQSPFRNVHYYAVAEDKEVLNKRIEERCEYMWENGLVEETQHVLNQGVSPTAQSLHTVGYREVLHYLGYGKNLTRSEAVKAHVVATKQYAKRQRTWFTADSRYQQRTASDAVTDILRQLNRYGVALFLALCTTLGVLAQTDSSFRGAVPYIVTQYDSVQAVRKLSRTLDDLFSSKVVRGARVSCRVWNITRNTLVYDRNPEENLTPASTTKLFTTAAAFHALGKDGKITTEVHATGKLDSDGTLHGDVYIVGTGDALLTVQDLEMLADDLYRSGIRTITGSVCADGTFFDDVGNRAIYSGDFEDVQKTPHVRALSLNAGVYAVVVSTSRKGHVNAQLIPESDAADLRLLTRGKKGAKRKQRLHVTSVVNDGRQIITVHGAPRVNRTQTFYVEMADPALATAGVLANRLRTGGITVKGRSLIKSRPPTSRLIASINRPLTEVCSIVNKRSHNYFAEHVFKFVGGIYGGRSNTARIAKQALLTTLDSLNVDRRNAQFNDGSGLSRRNIVCAATEVDLLRAIVRRPYGEEFQSTLAIAGVDGSLRNRMIGTAADGNVRAKTGTLRNTSALAGYVTTADNEQWCFAILSNGPNVRGYKTIEDKVAVQLASFSYSGKAWVPRHTSGSGSTRSEFDDSYEEGLLKDETSKSADDR